MSRKSTDVSRVEKISFIRKNIEIADKCFCIKPVPMYTEVFVNMLRRTYGYSERTNEKDICRSWKEAYRELKLRDARDRSLNKT